jgi:hypothetical protein
VVNLCLTRGDPSLLQAQAIRAGVSALLASMEQGLTDFGLLQPLPRIGKEAVGVGPGLVQEVLRRPPRLFPSQGWVGRPNGGRDPLARCGDDLHCLVVRPSQDITPRNRHLADLSSTSGNNQIRS